MQTSKFLVYSTIFVLGFACGCGLIYEIYNPEKPKQEIHFPEQRNRDSSVRAEVVPTAKFSNIPQLQKGDTVVRKIDFTLRGKRQRDTVHDTVNGIIHSIECPPCPDISGSVTLTNGKDGARATVKTDSGTVVSVVDQQAQPALQKPLKRNGLGVIANIDLAGNKSVGAIYTRKVGPFTLGGTLAMPIPLKFNPAAGIIASINF